MKREIFSSFFKIGLGTIGGGFAMLPMMEREIVERHQWLDKDDFLDVLAIAQASPGIFAVNMASHIGYKLGGIRLALIASFANILPSILIILAIAMVLAEFRDSQYVNYCFMAIRPVVVALILAPVFSLTKHAKLNGITIFIPIITAILICSLGISPIYIILVAIIFGGCYGFYLDRKNKQS